MQNHGVVRRTRKANCIHCLMDGEVTDDHVLPDSFYVTGNTGEKPTAPSCTACNSKHGKNEKRLLETLGFSFGFGDPRAPGIGEKVARSINPTVAKSARDMAHRIAAHRKLGSLMLPADDARRTLPGFGPDESGGTVAVRIDGHDLQMFTDKLVRGFTHWFTGEYIDTSFKLTFFLPDEGEMSEIVGMMERGAGVVAFQNSPSIRVRRLADDGEPFGAMFTFEIWSGRLKIVAEVSRVFPTSSASAPK